MLRNILQGFGEAVHINTLVEEVPLFMPGTTQIQEMDVVLVIDIQDVATLPDAQ